MRRLSPALHLLTPLSPINGKSAHDAVMEFPSKRFPAHVHLPRFDRSGEGISVVRRVVLCDAGRGEGRSVGVVR